MSDEHQQKPLRRRALGLYRAPFTFQGGYIYDAKGEMVADQGGGAAMARVRGWGRIGYLPEADKLHDEVGVLIAEALTKFWAK